MGESSVPSELREMFDMDSVEELAEDAAKRGSPERRGDMTRPLKNRKVRWLYRHFWSLEVDYIWRDHSERGVTYPLTHSQVKNLRPEYWVEDDVLNAYGELLRLREDKLWEKWEKISITESFKPRRYFITPSFFMAMALPNLKASPNTLKGDAKKSMVKLFRDYADKGVACLFSFVTLYFSPRKVDPIYAQLFASISLFIEIYGGSWS
ncbi:uncharacterized protein LOC141706181 isoform X3 [Apium graveolens]